MSHSFKNVFLLLRVFILLYFIAVLELSCIIQAITLECPTALVWCGTGSGTIWHGSPLDLLPVPPSSLPMPVRCDTNSYRKQLRQAESNIRERSKKAEGRWCMDKWQSSSTGKKKFLIWFVCCHRKKAGSFCTGDKYYYPVFRIVYPRFKQNFYVLEYRIVVGT